MTSDVFYANQTSDLYLGLDEVPGIYVYRLTEQQRYFWLPPFETIPCHSHVSDDPDVVNSTRSDPQCSCLLLGILPYPCMSKTLIRLIPAANHGAGIFTYKTAPSLRFYVGQSPINPWFASGSGVRHLHKFDFPRGGKIKTSP